MKKFDVEITETLQRTVSVEADSRAEAERLVTEAWNNEDYVLDSTDFVGVDVYDTANHDERRAILQQFIKEIRVRKDYEISITLNASFNQVEQLKAVSTYDGAEIFEGISEKGA